MGCAPEAEPLGLRVLFRDDRAEQKEQRVWKSDSHGGAG